MTGVRARRYLVSTHDAVGVGLSDMPLDFAFDANVDEICGITVDSQGGELCQWRNLRLRGGFPARALCARPITIGQFGSWLLWWRTLVDEI